MPEQKEKISRVWAMPSGDTFSIPPVSKLLDTYLNSLNGDTIIDPFARNSKRGTITNDLNPKMPTDFHLDAVEFCKLLKENGIIADVVLFDPPYSPRQISELYQSIGKKCGTKDTQNARLNKAVKDGLDAILKKGGLALSFGWNSSGFGKSRGYEVIEILLVAHGGAHNDTICVIENKL